jgi:hypothetical protein
MFLTFRMNSKIIGHDLEVLWKKMFGCFFGHFWGHLFGVKIWLLPHFSMVSGRSVDPSDSNLGGFLLKSTLNAFLQIKKGE